jgi:hypothetical protein
MSLEGTGSLTKTFSMRYATRSTAQQPTTNDLVMVVGPATTRNLLEIGILDRDGDDSVVIHAMHLRPKFQR